ncbi:MAG TPA: ABC transporter substrate-binding protein [Candidatus Brocadiia bacterium]|nr:ABC transporter substrate-binding protein [Candidatus Brocadiia bacterium]
MKPQFNIIPVIVICLCALVSCRRTQPNAAPQKPPEASEAQNKSGVSEHPKAYVPVVGKRGGEWLNATISGPKSFNAVVSNETSTGSAIGPIFEGLTTADPDTLMPQPKLAESWHFAEDGSSCTFNLRAGVKWNDGMPFTADDVVFTYEKLYLNPEIPNSTGDILTIEDKRPKVVKVDELTVRFDLPWKYAPFVRAMSADILPLHKLGNLSAAEFQHHWGLDTPPSELVGTGPFKLVSYEPEQRLIYERNPHYWKKDAAGNQLPYLDRYITSIVKDLNVAYLKFKNKETDVYGLRPEDFQVLNPLQKQNDFTIYRLGPGTGCSFVFFNQNTNSNSETGKPFVQPHKLKWFRDARFRRAVAHALDRDTMINNVLYGLACPQYGPMTISEGFFFNPDVKKYDFDKRKSKALLAEMGFKDVDGDKVLEDEQGNKLQFTMLTNVENNVRVSLANIIAKDLKDLGMEINFQPMPFNPIVAKLDASYDWECVLLGLTGGPEPHFGSNIWTSRAYHHMWFPSQKMPSSDWEARIDELFTLGVQELDPEKRKVYYDEWQVISSEQLPLIYTVVQEMIVAVRNRFGNIHPTPHGGVTHNLEEIFVKE